MGLPSNEEADRLQGSREGRAYIGKISMLGTPTAAIINPRGPKGPGASRKKGPAHCPGHGSSKTTGLKLPGLGSVYIYTPGCYVLTGGLRLLPYRLYLLMLSITFRCYLALGPELVIMHMVMISLTRHMISPNSIRD